MPGKLVLSLLCCFSALAFVQITPTGFFIHQESRSPDGRYGVAVPMLDYSKKVQPDPKNSLIEIKTAQTLAVIQAETGWDRGNHRTILPARWSPDSSLLLWEVDGKWFSAALVLLKLKEGRVLWQTNLLQSGQDAILARTKKAVPARYAENKKANAGSGSAYPEGFAIDVEVVGPIALPLQILVNLTSNVKMIPDRPTLETHLKASVDAEGKFTVKDFALGPSPGHSF